MGQKAVGIMAAALALVGSSPALADDWVMLAENTDSSVTWEGRAGSLQRAENNSHEQIYTAKGRVTYTKTKLVEFEQWYVRAVDCRTGSGKIVTTDMAGNFKFESDFVLRGGNIASSLADMLCILSKEDAGKGLPPT